MRRKSSGPWKMTSPSPDSPFYVPPPSSKALRWSIVFCLFGPFIFAFTAFECVLSDEWAGLVLALVVLFAYSGLEWVRIRTILRELARRRTGGSTGRSGNPATPADDDAEEAARRRKVAWARVRHDVFPILSNPSVLKRPFEKWDDWQDERSG
jgi:hypothetical protein